MRFPSTAKIVIILLVGVALCSCSGDSNQPTTLKQQQDAMHQPPPSAADLKQAMSKVHFKTPGSNAPQTPPEGTVLPGAGKGTH